jgi:prepilin-type processing-associated H-X9-DG protein
LVELLVVIAIIGILVALLLPAIQAAREAARRTQCNNNLKNVTLGLQNYHDTYKTFPMGAMHAGIHPSVNATGTRLGPSWWYGIMPFMEQRNIYDKIAATQRAGATMFAPTDLDTVIAGQPIRKLVPDFMKCPSSPLPDMETQIGYIAMPSYVGIAGGCDINTASTDYTGITPAITFTTTRTYTNQQKATLAANNGSVITSSGMLPLMQHVGMQGCTDGTSNTMIVGEQSDWLRSTVTTDSTKFHGDPGWNTGTGTAGTAGGWISGTEWTNQIARVAPGGTPAAITPTHLWNITTVRYKPMFKNVIGGTTIKGTGEVMGHNNPLQAAHPGGLQVAFVDGSVQFISGTLDMAVLLRIAIKDDGQNVKLD